MKRFPLLFDYRETVVGKGYIAQVVLDGRALIEAEGETSKSEAWLYGVYPGAIAGSGDSIPAAYLDFRTRLTAVLYDFAEDAQDFTSFEAEVKRFFKETDDQTVQEWEAARRTVGRGGADEVGLPKKYDPPDPSVRVEKLRTDQLSPAANDLERPYMVAA